MSLIIKNVTQKLLYEDISYDYAIENGIAIVAESDVFVYKKSFVLYVGKKKLIKRAEFERYLLENIEI